ncbi:MAG: type II secretion system F family protein [Chakrabartia sp.]
MDLTGYLSIGLSFVTVCLLFLAGGAVLRERLGKKQALEASYGAGGGLAQGAEALVTWFRNFATRLSGDESVRKSFVSEDRVNELQRAGFESESASDMFIAAKVLSFALLTGLGVWIAFARGEWPLSQQVAVVLVLALAGSYLPDMVLKSLIKRRAQEMRHALPDMLDLLVIGVEAGLGLDAAIARVSNEFERRSPALANEFYKVSLEIRAGAARTDALRNFGKRTQLDEIQSLVATLVQAERFGTDMAQSLRVQSDLMRTTRMLKAEEAAAKTPSKLALPLVLLIFPVLLMVILGPAAILTLKAMAQ